MKLKLIFLLAIMATSIFSQEEKPKIMKAPAQAQIIPGELIIKFRPRITDIESSQILQEVGIKAVKTFPDLNIKTCQILAEKTVEQVIEECKDLSDIEYAEPSYRVYALEQPNDPEYDRLWGLNNTGQTGGSNDADIDAEEAWDIEEGNRQVIVGVIDTGIDYDHEDLRLNMWRNPGEINNNNIDDDNNGYVDDYYGWDFFFEDNNPFDDNQHGTHVAGTIGAVGNNARGVVGVNWQISLMALKFLDNTGSGSTSDAIEAIIYASDMGANILNNSWGGGGFSQAMKDAITYAKNKGVLFVAAAGNDSKNTDLDPNYPSNYDVENVISVAASSNNDKLAGFSNYGAETVDLAAPGENIYSTIPNSRYASLSGTSMATPHVVGAAALIWSYYLQNSNWEKVKFRLFGATDYVFNFQGKMLLDGRLNVNTALTDVPLIALISKPLDTDDTTNPYKVRASVIDNDTIISAKLFYQYSGAISQADTIELTNIGPYQYEFDLPATRLNTAIKYKIVAEDNEQNITETRYYSFKVGETSSGCCGAFAATVTIKEASIGLNLAITLLINLIIVFGVPIILKLKKIR
jgi:subtilisin family serine protease